VFELYSVCIHAGVQRRDSEHKSCVEIKPVMVVKRVEILQFIFAKVVQEHTLGAVGSAYLILLEIYSGVTVPKLYKLVDSQLSYCENKKRVSVFLRRSVGYVKITAVVRLSMQLSTARPGPSRTMYLGHSYLGHGQSHKIGPQGQGLGSRTTSLAVGTSRSSKVAKNHNALQRRDNCFATLTWTTDHKVLTNLAN